MTRTSGIIVIGGLAALASACGGTGREPAAQTPTPVAVTATAVVSGTIAERLEAGGVIAAQESAVVSSRVTAPILSVRVKAGDRMRAGDVLITLDARDVAAQSRQAVAATLAAEQALVRARSEQAAAAAEQTLAAAWHTRIAALRERNSATAQELDEAEARQAGANARAAAAQAGIDQATAVISASRAAADAAVTTESFTVIRAPFDGIVAERLIDPGNLATPGAPLLRVEGTGRRRLEVRVDESRVAYIQPGDRVEVAVGLADAAGDEEVAEGTVEEVARAFDAGQRAFTVKVAVPPTERARSGTFGRIRFRGAPRQALVIPSGALRRQGQVASVFVVQDGLARLRLVRPGDAVDQGVEVLAGLEAGEMVVTAPPPSLVDGQPVTVTEAGAQSGGRP